jgi:hypothetical protein
MVPTGMSDTGAGKQQNDNDNAAARLLPTCDSQIYLTYSPNNVYISWIVKNE